MASKPNPTPVTLGWLNMDLTQGAPDEQYAHLVGAIYAAHKLGQRVEARPIYSERTGYLTSIEFTARPTAADRETR